MPCFQLFHVGSLDHATWKIGCNVMPILQLKAHAGQLLTKACFVVIQTVEPVRYINYLKNARVPSNLSKKSQTHKKILNSHFKIYLAFFNK